MNKLRSLKFRIAATVFLLELIMLSIVLWQTQSVAYDRAQQEIDLQDNSIINLLANVSHTALLTTEFTEVSPLFEETTGSPHIVEIRLYDDRERVIAASKLKALGNSKSSEAFTTNSYWRDRIIESGSEAIGELRILFSSDELNAAYRETLAFGYTLAATGMVIIAIAGLLLGHILTRRLSHVIQQTRRLAAGDLDCRCIVNGDDEITLLAGSLNHMARQLSSSFERIQHLAFHDALTGLSNRMDFDQRLHHAVVSAHTRQQHHALLYIDLDQFKIVNDTCGHDAGDRLLVELAEILTKSIRGRDTISRLGGDEFGVLLENCDLNKAKDVAEKIRQEVEAYRFTWQDRIFRIGASIGVVSINSETRDSKQVLSLADMACYAAKDNGRNSIYIAGDQDEDIAIRSHEMHWTVRIEEAMEQHRFLIHQQAIVRVDNLKDRPYSEFLLRLQGSDGELIYPASFLPAAERFGLSGAIDRHTIALVFSHLKNTTVTKRPKLAFINLSGASVGDTDLYNYIEQQFTDHNIPPSEVCFEITETAAINNFSLATSFIHKLRRLGCHFALDDFGSGMCSFTYLKSLDVDFIKIDGSFITNMASNPIDLSIVSAINTVAHEANYETIAEFAESEKTLKQLLDLGVDFAQGHIIDRPHAVE